MKKVKIPVILTVFLSVFLAISFAEESNQTQMPMMGKGMMSGKMAGDSMGGKAMGGMMMKMMMPTEIVPTSDGGVVVLVGNKLIKYDKNLNLVKEVEIKIDVDSMQKMMEGMREKCTKHKEMMKEKEEAPTEEVSPHAIDSYHHAPKN